MDKMYWMIIANSSCMKLFKFAETSRSLEKPSVTLHPESVLKQQDFDTDKHGRESHGFGHDSESIPAKKIEEKKFAKEISHFLKKSYTNKEFSRLYIAASPSMLGILREELPKELHDCIAEEVNKDLTKVHSHEIWSHFPSHHS